MDWIRKETDSAMKVILILFLTASSNLFAQDGVNAIHYQTAGSDRAIAWGGVGHSHGTPVEGAPYSATTTNKSIQKLEDGTQIVQTSTGTIARDSQGRTRQDAPLPTIDDVSANAPHLVFIEDPVTRTSYILNLTDKTLQKIPMPSARGVGFGGNVESKALFMQMGSVATMSGPLPVPTKAANSNLPTDEQANSESLGSETMEGLLVNGVRTTHTIPAGQIGNAKPIKIVTEVWTSPDLKTDISSKRSDPLMGEQVFRLTNIARAEPDASLFTIPADFQIIDDPQVITSHPNQE
jgi:hypothetical protein